MSTEVATDRDAGRRAVVELCESFGARLAYYRSPEFDETTARQRFIDPLMSALGWDVADDARRGPYADVILEYSLPRERRAPGEPTLGDEEAEDARVEQAVAEAEEAPPTMAVRRPDYSFRLNGVPQFFVEAKRPSVNIASPRPIFQVKSYGWSARTPLALLTDFEDLLVFDCRQRPVVDEPNTGLLTDFKLNFREYPEAWDRLWDTFSREAVAGGALVRYAEEVLERRGQLAVDRAFLDDLGRWRKQVAQSYAKLNPDLNVWQLNDATQLTLDRIVFIRVCEDRRLEPEMLRPLLDEEEPYESFIKSIAPLRANYNGGLLDPDLADTLELDPQVFRRVIRGVYAPWSPYRFDVLGVAILGSIYERALGSEILLDEKRTVSVELKPEVRKSGGVYYTPQWVVDEIVRLSLEPLIAGKAPNALRGFRVLDPACGSGSFLLAAYARLARHYEEYYSEHPTVDRRWHTEAESNGRRLTSEGKGRVLRNHIFGVDVDPAAVEVTMMSLYLKSLEAESAAYLHTQMQLGGAILPSLEANIRVGNSLVSTDFYAQQQLGQLDEYEEHRLRPFKWDSDQQGFGSILREGGFDVVIGNPPYFNIDATYGAKHPVPAYLSRAYPAVYTDKTDIYYYFLAKAIELAKQRVGFIVSRAFLEADKATNVREQLPQHAALDHLVDFNAFQVFFDAGIATAVVVFDTTRPHDDTTVDVRKLETADLRPIEVVDGLRAGTEPFDHFERKGALGGAPWRFPSPVESALYEVIDAAGDPLWSLCHLGQGMQTGANSVFASLSNDEVTELCLPRELVKRRARNSDIHSFFVADSERNALYLEDVASFADLPESVRDYLERPENEQKLKDRAAYKRGDCDWWRYTWALNKRYYDRPRLICPYRTRHNRFALDRDFFYVSLTDTTVAFLRDEVEEDPLYLLGLLNSTLLTFRFRGLGKLTSPNMWEAFDNSIRDLPIRRIDFQNSHDRALHERVVELASSLEDATEGASEAPSASGRSIAARRAEGLRDELDALVMDMYRITEASDKAEVLSRGAPIN